MGRKSDVNEVTCVYCAFLYLVSLRDGNLLATRFVRARSSSYHHAKYTHSIWLLGKWGLVESISKHDTSPTTIIQINNFVLLSTSSLLHIIIAVCILFSRGDRESHRGKYRKTIPLCNILTLFDTSQSGWKIHCGYTLRFLVMNKRVNYIVCNKYRVWLLVIWYICSHLPAGRVFVLIFSPHCLLLNHVVHL